MNNAGSNIVAPPLAVGHVRLLVLGIVATTALFPLVTRDVQIAALVGTVLMTGWAWTQRSQAPAHLGFFCSFSLTLFLLGIPFSQLVFGLSLTAYALIVRRTPWLNGAMGWAKPGTINGRALFMITTVVVATVVALATWLLTLRPNLRDLVATFIPQTTHRWFLIIGAVLFSAINAALEEIAYRGILMYALEAAVGTGIAAVVLQAIAFGTLHINGFPRGWIGVGLAMIYGVALGMLRRYSRGMIAPWIAHMLTDMAIAGMLLTYVA